MIKVYLNANEQLAISVGNVERYPSLNNAPIFDNNRDTFELRGLFQETKIGDIKKEDGSDYSDLNELKAVVLSFFVKAPLSGAKVVQGGASLNYPTQITASTDWVEITGNFTNYDDNGKFSIINEELTYNGDSCSAIMVGSSNLKAAKVSVVEYALAINGTVSSIQTQHTFGNAQSIEHISATGHLQLQNGDTLKIFAKSSTSNNNLDIITLDFSILTNSITFD